MKNEVKNIEAFFCWCPCVGSHHSHWEPIEGKAKEHKCFKKYKCLICGQVVKIQERNEENDKASKTQN